MTVWTKGRPIDLQMTIALLKSVYMDAYACHPLEVAAYERAESMRLSQLLLMYDGAAAAWCNTHLGFTQEDIKIFCPSMLMRKEEFSSALTHGEDGTSSRLKVSICSSSSVLRQRADGRTWFNCNQERECVVGALCGLARFIRNTLGDGELFARLRFVRSTIDSLPSLASSLAWTSDQKIQALHAVQTCWPELEGMVLPFAHTLTRVAC